VCGSGQTWWQTASLPVLTGPKRLSELAAVPEARRNAPTLSASRAFAVGENERKPISWRTKCHLREGALGV